MSSEEFGKKATILSAAKQSGKGMNIDFFFTGCQCCAGLFRLATKERLFWLAEEVEGFTELTHLETNQLVNSTINRAFTHTSWFLFTVTFFKIKMINLNGNYMLLEFFYALLFDSIFLFVQYCLGETKDLFLGCPGSLNLMQMREFCFQDPTGSIEKRNCQCGQWKQHMPFSAAL